MEQMFISELQGLQIPISRIDYNAWKLTVSKKIKINVSTSDEGPVFSLTEDRLYTFALHCYKIGAKESIIVDQLTSVFQGESEPLLDSKMFLSMSEKSSARLQENIRDIAKYISRKHQSEELINSLNQVISEDANNPQLKEQKKKLRVRTRKLEEALEILKSLEESKSEVILSDVSIKEARESPEWNDMLNQLYLDILYNSDIGSSMSSPDEEVEDTEEKNDMPYEEEPYEEEAVSEDENTRQIETTGQPVITL